MTGPTEIPVEKVEQLRDVPTLRCPMCGHQIEPAELGGFTEGPFIIWFHDRDGCQAVLGMSNGEI